MRATAASTALEVTESSDRPRFYRALLGAMVTAEEEGVDRLQSASDRLNLVDGFGKSLSVLKLQTRNGFRQWVRELDREALRTITSDVLALHRSKVERLNDLASSIFDEESAKARGAIFTPTWLVERLVRSAHKNWTRLNVGKQPSLAGDLSCGPGAFLSSLASKLPSKTKIVGVDNCPEYVALARVLNHRLSSVEVHCLDTLVTLRSSGQLIFQKVASPVPSTGYEILVGNPPYVRCQSLALGYAKALRELYPNFTAGNFDLASLFLAHTLEALAPGGVAALVVSSKFMNSRYGNEICRRIGQQARLLEIVDFGDGQVFQGRTTYTCTLTFAKLPANGPCKVLQFVPGLKWEDGSQMSTAQVADVPAERFRTAPWNLSSGSHDDVLRLMRRPECRRLSEIFPNINQGIRTGANQFFLIPKAVAEKFEGEVILPFVSGENIRRCRILSPEYYLIWPYRFTEIGSVVAIREDELQRSYPRTAEYLRDFRNALSARDLEAGSPWYSYSRSQNLDLASRPKIIGRELMPRAEFAADEDGKFAICSGYAFLPASAMATAELRMWAAVLCTPTMEFQLRHTCTQLHSGWFRILKHQLAMVRVPPFSRTDLSAVTRLADQLHKLPDDLRSLAKLDAIVARVFGLSDEHRSEIKSYLQKHHAVSAPNELFESARTTNHSDGAESSRQLTGNSIFSLSAEDKQKYLPVELSQYYKLHCERENLRQSVTFVDNKNRPIHRWYSFTQGFSGGLVKELVAELGASRKSRVYDPFAGSGTTLLTCKQEGITSFGAEISPLMCWVTRVKTSKWDSEQLRGFMRTIEKVSLRTRKVSPSVFNKFFEQAYAPQILDQIFAWREVIKDGTEPPVRDFFLLALISILEIVSQLRKHGSHYRFLNKTDSLGLAKLNIPVINSDAEIKPVLLDQLTKMISDIELAQHAEHEVATEIFNLDSRSVVPANRTADFVLTSPPYLNRNMYFAQQKAELVLLEVVRCYEDYQSLVQQTFRSHVEGRLPGSAKSDIPEVQRIVEGIHLTENNNAKIPHMVCGYFEDLSATLSTLRPALASGAKLAFVVGNCRWGGVVVPVDHLLALIAERLGYEVERIIVTRLKGNSPQQMRRYGRIPMRESIVLLRWN